MPEAQALKTRRVKDTQGTEGKDKARPHIACSTLSTLEATRLHEAQRAEAAARGETVLGNRQTGKKGLPNGCEQRLFFDHEA